MTDIESEAREALIEGVKLEARNSMRHDPRVWHEALEAALDKTLPGFWDAALASRVSTPPSEDELERLRAWKAEATEVLGRWEQVWEAAARPGRIGRSKADNVREWIESLAVSTPTSEDEIITRFSSLSNYALARIANAAERVIEGRNQDGVIS